MTTVFLVTGFSMLFSAGVMVYNCKREREREREISRTISKHTHEFEAQTFEAPFLPERTFSWIMN